MKNSNSIPETDIEVNTDPCSAPNEKFNSISQLLIFFAVGIFFGSVLTKAEVTSWIRIQEMFQFKSFHLYGVIGSAIFTAFIGTNILRLSGTKSIMGDPIKIRDVDFHMGQIIGGLCFGIGWALTGACPGPIFAIIGSGHLVFIVILISVLAGTLSYGWLRNRLPH
jgi:uncharacterized membrane protein YedE/YeeE